jgi:quinol-cytochrome oxidoreductase complex cytochrome b subunit
MEADFVKGPPPSAEAPPGVGLEGRVEEQLGIRALIREYLIPVETNSIWYLLGGVLAISLVLEIFTGMLLTFAYVPDAGKAYDITKGLINSPG